jgi:hypothetical protein
MRILSTSITTAIGASVTAPGYLVQIDATDGTLRYCTRGTVDYQGSAWIGGADVESQGAEWSVGLPNHESAASALALSDDLNQARVRIWYWVEGGGNVAALVDDASHALLIDGTHGLIIESDADAVLLFDGSVNAASEIGLARVRFSLSAGGLGSRYQPSDVIAPPTFNHLIQPGTRVVWGENTYHLEPA